MKRCQDALPGARHTTPMISLDRLVCRAYSAQALKRRLEKIHRSQSRLPPTPATGVQPEHHRNALDRKVLQKTPVLAMAQSQTCHRYRKCTKVASEHLNRGFPGECVYDRLGPQVRLPSKGREPGTKRPSHVG